MSVIAGLAVQTTVECQTTELLAVATCSPHGLAPQVTQACNFYAQYQRAMCANAIQVNKNTFHYCVQLPSQSIDLQLTKLNLETEF